MAIGLSQCVKVRSWAKPIEFSGPSHRSSNARRAGKSKDLGLKFADFLLQIHPSWKRGFSWNQAKRQDEEESLGGPRTTHLPACVWHYLYVVVQWEPNTCLKTKSESTEQSRLARIPKTDSLVLTRLTLVIISISESQEIYPFVTKRILLGSESRIDGLVMSKFHLLHSSGGTLNVNFQRKEHKLINIIHACPTPAPVLHVCDFLRVFQRPMLSLCIFVADLRGLGRQ